MYHPAAMFKIAHDREAELVREAQACGMPQAERDPNRGSITSVMVVLTITILIATARLLIA